MSLDRLAYLGMAALLLTGFLLAGGGRDDLLSLVIWRPLSMIFLALAICIYWREAWQNGQALVLFGLVVVLLPALHLVPLPPAIWSSLPGREFIAAIYRDAGMTLPWQPLSVAQARTWNALFSLGAPLAMLFLVLSTDMKWQRRIVLILLGIGFISGIIGTLQAIGPAQGPLYFYRITNNGYSVGFFANRNHQAAFLASMYPLLAANLSFFKGKPEQLLFHRSMAIIGGLLLLVLILMTGSRGGVALAVLGVVAAWWVYRAPVAQVRSAARATETRTRIIGFGLALLLMVFAAIVAVRTPAVRRLMEGDPSSELRVSNLSTVMEAVNQFFPFGSGLGTFVEAFQLFERNDSISATYFNHAHNDFVEILLTAGVPGVAMILWAAILGFMVLRVLVKSRNVKSNSPEFQSQVLGRAGISILAMLALYSAADYPLRVPSLMLLAVIAAGWCSNACRVAQR
ncbi:O-antigen polymerase [Sphingopyxis sp. LC81]|uniref:O-antigen ligase family protein n=1 Tax=Sphingopyxis sp. LC81 TaxID=1502850 RepID=UPI00050FA297|nr:O-antigen ligase family protein [Sphingopyxis sp. LC81]KGB54062.1 O-antigen polymerase [Sphingopyxis sp. LC81]